MSEGRPESTSGSARQPEGDTSAVVGADLSRAAGFFNFNTTTLWDLSKWMTQEVFSNEARRLSGARLAAEMGLVGKEAERFSRLWEEDMQRNHEPRPDGDVKGEHADPVTAEETTRADTESPERPQVAESLDYLVQVRGPAAMARMARVLVVRPYGEVTLHRALLVFAVGAVESLVAQVARARLQLHPSALATSKQEYSLEDLIRLGSLDALIAEATEKRVDGLCFGSLQDWAEWFDKNLKISLSELALHWDETWEVFQRRHVVIHNDSTASRLYVERVKDSDVQVGDVLPVDSRYLERALDLITVLGTRMIASAWARLVKDDTEEVTVYLREAAYGLLQAERWDAAAPVAAHARDLADPETYTYWAAQVNEWLALREINAELEAQVERDVKAWNVETRGRLWRVAKAALQEDLDTLVELVPPTVAEGDLSRNALLRDWPLFGRLREKEEFLAVVAAVDENAARERGA